MSSKDNIKRIFWDWHGVLGYSGFWNRASKENYHIKKFCDAVFSDEIIIQGWMRDDFSFEHLVDTYASKSLTVNKLVELYIRDQVESGINEPLFKVVSSLHPKAKHYLITDNMDIFAKHYANSYPDVFDRFDGMFMSCNYKRLKRPETDNLFDAALGNLGLVNFNESLLLDDSYKNCTNFSKLGGQFIFVG